MNSTVTIRMASGAEHEILLPTAGAGALTQDLVRFWTGRPGKFSQRLNRTDGTSILINPMFVESVEVR